MPAIPPHPVPAPDAPRIQRGVPEGLRAAAAALYWQHFGAQILPFPTATRHGQALVLAAMRPAQAMVALSPQGGLLALLGLRDAGGGFLDASVRPFTKVWGWPGGRLRHASLALYQAGGSACDLVLDGLAVDPAARRQGLARALVGAAADLARAQGHPALRAEVEAGNHAALAAWQALGFQPLGREKLGWPWLRPAHVLRLTL